MVPGTTTLCLSLQGADRVRLENVTIDCRDNPFLELRQHGAVSLKNCEVVNYNSGAGGSNAVYASGTTLLIDGRTFDGAGGRSAGPNSRGNVFDLRGNNRAYARNTKFLNNAEIARSECITFDGCMVSTPTFPPRRATFKVVAEPVTLLSATVKDKGPGRVQAGLGRCRVPRSCSEKRGFRGRFLSEGSQQLGLQNDPSYWLGFLRN